MPLVTLGLGSLNQVAANRYDVSCRVYNVADFGIPQVRKRVFIVGFRHDLGATWTFPEPTHSEDALLYAQYVEGSYWVEHGLSRREVPSRLAGRITRLATQPKPTALRWRTVRDALAIYPNQSTRRLLRQPC